MEYRMKLMSGWFRNSNIRDAPGPQKHNNYIIVYYKLRVFLLYKYDFNVLCASLF